METWTCTSEVGIVHFAYAPLDHNKPHTYLILVVFLLKLQFPLKPTSQPFIIN